MFVTRLISGIVLVAVALLTICSGGWILYGTLTIVSLIGMFELYRAVKVQKQGENLLAVVGYLGVILHYILLSLGYSEYAMMNLIIVLIAMMLFNWAPAARNWRARVMEKVRGSKNKREVA